MSNEIQVFRDLRIKMKKKDQEIEDLKAEREYWKGRASFLGWEVYRLRAAQREENTDSESNNYPGDKLVVGKTTPVSKSGQYNDDSNKERKKLVAKRRQTNNYVDGEKNKVEAQRGQDNIDGDRKRTKVETKRNHDNYDSNREKSKVVAKRSRDNYDSDRERSMAVAKRRYTNYEDNREGEKVVAKRIQDNYDVDRERPDCSKRRHDHYDDNRELTKVVTKSSNTMMLGNENSDKSRGQVDESLCNEANLINRRYSAVYRERISAVEKTDNIDREHISEIEEDCPYQLWKCLNCPKTFRFAAGLAIHLEAHYPGNRPVISCPMNDQFSGTVEKMTEHLRSKHTEERLFPCSKCNVKLATIGALKQHEIKHRMSHVWRKCSNCPAFFNIVVGKCRFCKTSE